ncbi:hypothetical protein [Planctomicrobium sp. SH527]|uniref:hypothetical protein n=1 Tax=Planctomicrobium sp. SH527 TaxID=3448123 RepID=UPI003F5BC5CA
MDGSIQLTAEERKMLLQTYRFGGDGHISRSAHVMRVKEKGLNWQQIKDVLFFSFGLISQTLNVFAQGRTSGILEQQALQRRVPAWMMKVLRWGTEHSPRDFVYFSSRWTCETLAHLLAFESGLRFSGETIRGDCAESRGGWRRPRPESVLLPPTTLRNSSELSGFWGIFPHTP